jgi:hypothetical protein
MISHLCRIVLSEIIPKSAVLTINSFGYISRSGIAGSNGRFMFSFFKKPPRLSIR